MCKCAACGHIFEAENAFDRHRIGSHKNRTRTCISLPAIANQWAEDDLAQNPAPGMRQVGLQVSPKGYFQIDPAWKAPKRRKRVSISATNAEVTA